MVGSTDGVAQAGESGSYEDLCREIARFFQMRQPPVSPKETIEILAFMEAAHESKRLGGVPVSLPGILAKACAEASPGKK